MIIFGARRVYAKRRCDRFPGGTRKPAATRDSPSFENLPGKAGKLYIRWKVKLPGRSVSFSMAAIETTILFLVFVPLPFRRIPSEIANHRPPTFFTLSVVSHGPAFSRLARYR